MNISRRWFIGGAASLGAFQGCRFIESPFGRNGVARLKFGVISDIHIIAENTDRTNQGNTRTLKRAFRWFDAQGADGVVIAGDMADAGLISQLQCVADAWNAVFPGGRSKFDGRPVEKLFVYGNHDGEGYGYGYSIYNVDPRELPADQIRAVGMKKVWEEVFEEEYAPVYRKVVKGYSFVGAHWHEQGCRQGDVKQAHGLLEFYAANAKAFDPKKPFFHIQHPHPKDTIYGSWAWGHDRGLSTQALSAFPNAVAFSGHSHYPLTDERSVWQGAFTSVGTASLRYLDYPYNEFLPEGFENTTTDWSKDSWRLNAEKLTPRIHAAGQQGMLWRVYDDCMVVQRRDYQFDQDVGPDWVIPLSSAEPRPFAFAEQARKSEAPKFPAGAALKLSRTTAKNRGGKGGKDRKEEVLAVERPVIRVEIPQVEPNARARAYYFEVTAKGGDVTKTKRVAAKGSPNALGHAETKAPTFCLFAADDFPQGPVTVSVVPENWFHRRGGAISGTI